MSVGYVYYVQRKYGVKIGTSIDVAKRVKQIRKGGDKRPDCLGLGDVQILAVHGGGRDAEQIIHRRLRAGRMEGEWFQIDHPVVSTHLAHVIRLCGTEDGWELRPPPRYEMPYYDDHKMVPNCGCWQCTQAYEKAVEWYQANPRPVASEWQNGLRAVPELTPFQREIAALPVVTELPPLDVKTAMLLLRLGLLVPSEPDRQEVRA